MFKKTLNLQGENKSIAKKIADFIRISLENKEIEANFLRDLSNFFTLNPNDKNSQLQRLKTLKLLKKIINEKYNDLEKLKPEELQYYSKIIRVITEAENQDFQNNETKLALHILAEANDIIQGQTIKNAPKKIIKSTSSNVKSLQEFKQQLDNLQEEYEHTNIVTDSSGKIKEQDLKQDSGNLLTKQQIQQAINFFASKEGRNVQKISKKTKPFNLPFSIIKIVDAENKECLFALYNVVLGEGSSGRVKVAQNLKTNEVVAAKIQKKDTEKLPKSDKSKIEETIKLEESVQRSVDQYIGSQYRKGEYEDKYYTFSKFIKGDTLNNYLVYPEETTIMQKLEVALLAFKATKDLHDKHIIHGDLSFNNMLYDQTTQQLNIIDFGSSGKTVNAGESIPVGSPNFLLTSKFDPESYFAKECYGEVGVKSIASDLYSLGVWVNWRIAKIKTIPSDIKQDLNNLVDKMCNHNPTDRGTIDEHIFHLEKILNKLSLADSITIPQIEKKSGNVI